MEEKLHNYYTQVIEMTDDEKTKSLMRHKKAELIEMLIYSWKLNDNYRKELGYQKPYNTPEGVFSGTANTEFTTTAVTHDDYDPSTTSVEPEFVTPTSEPHDPYMEEQPVEKPMDPNRKKAQELALSWIRADIASKGENAIAMSAPNQPGKNTWTQKEMLEAVLNDRPLENGGNPIDDVLAYLKNAGQLTM